MSPSFFAKMVKSLPGNERLGAIKNYLADLSLEARNEAETILLGELEKPDTVVDPEVVVVFLHGIRTLGEWQHRIQDMFIGEFGVKAYAIGPGSVIDFLSFWFPLGTRKRFIRSVKKRLDSVRALHPGAKIVLVAHSFGTYTACEILKSDVSLSLARLLLCGSIVSASFDWESVRYRIGAQGSVNVVNDVGVRDVWPVVAHAVTFGYGPTGTWGAKHPCVRDRFFDMAHSDFFDDGHVRTYWAPFLIDGQIVSSKFTSERGTAPWWSRVIPQIPFRYLIWLGVPAWLCFSVLYLR